MHFQTFHSFLLDKLTRVDLKNYGYHTHNSVSIMLVQFPLTAMKCV